MSLNETIEGSIGKKIELLHKDFGRFAFRAALAGIYLTLATAFAGVAGQAVEVHAKGLGPHCLCAPVWYRTFRYYCA